MSLFETLQHRRGRVLFVSEANDCQDQMAEAFARALGEDSILAFSAGIHPAEAVSEATRAVMAEKAVPLTGDQKPKALAGFDLSGFDVVVNLTARSLPAALPALPATSAALASALILEPPVPSPLAGDLESHRAVCDRMEAFVRFLIEHFRRAKEWTPETTPELRREPSATPAPQTMPVQPPVEVRQPDASTAPAF